MPDGRERRTSARAVSTPAAAIDAIWRTESPKLVGALTCLVRDLAVAEELAHDAVVAALEQWPRDGQRIRPRG